MLYQHNAAYQNPSDPNLPNTYYYEVHQDTWDFVIHRCIESQPFEFEAVLWNAGWTGDPNDPNHYVSPGDIRLIMADTNAGPVVVTVIGDINLAHGQNYGAANIGQIVLVGNGVTGAIGALRISDNLGDLGPIRAALIDGDCVVGSRVTSDVTVGSLYGELNCHGLGNVTVTDATTGPRGTRIVNNDQINAYTGTIDVAGDLEYLKVVQEMRGLIHVGRDALSLVLQDGGDGAVQVERDLYSITQSASWYGAIAIGRDLVGLFRSSGYCGTALTVGRDWLGRLYTPGPVTGTITVGRDFSGSIYSYIAGDLSAAIEIGTGAAGGNLTPSGLIEVAEASLAGPITIHGDLDGAINVGWAYPGPEGGNILPGADILVEGEMSDGIESTGSMLANIRVAGDMHGAISCGADLRGVIRIDGSVTELEGYAATLEFENLRDPNGDLRGGHVIVNGAFGRGTPYTRMDVYGTVDPTAFVAFNYDGPPPVGSWVSPAYVFIPGLGTFTHTIRELRIWGIFIMPRRPQWGRCGELLRHRAVPPGTDGSQRVRAGVPRAGTGGGELGRG